MTTANPYQTPQANLDNAGQDQEYSKVKIFSIRGRLGRIRYIGYTWAFSLLFGVAFGIVMAVLTPIVGPATVHKYMTSQARWLVDIPIFFMTYILSIQRAHDFGRSRWFALLGLVPLVNLYFLFKAGTEGENRYGKPTPPPNRTAVWVVAGLAVLGIVGILAAIAVPAYLHYVHAAQAAAYRR